MTDKQKDNPEKVMTVQEVSAYLKIPVSTIYDLTRKGKLRGVKVGRQWRYLEADIVRFLHGETVSSRLPVYPIERRTHPRVRTRIPARLAAQLAGDSRLETSGMLQNLSKGGALFVCENGNGNSSGIKKLEAGHPVKMIFEICENGSTSKMEVMGRIVRLVINSEVKTGIQFQNLSSKQQEVIQDYVG